MAKTKKDAEVPAAASAQTPVSVGETGGVPALRSEVAPARRGAFLAMRVPQTTDEIQFIAQNAAQSGLFKDIRNPAQAVVKILAGMEMGIPAMVALRKFYIIEGNLVASAEIMGAKIKQDHRYWFEVLVLNEERCEIGFWRSLGPAEPEEIKAFRKMGTYREAVEQLRNLVIDGQHYGFTYRSVFRKQDGAAAGKVDTGKVNWDRYLRNMLFARALSNGARWACSDVINGLYVPEDFDLATEGDEIVWDEAAERKLAKNVRTAWHLQAVNALKPHLKPQQLDTLRLKWADNTMDNEAFTVLLERTAADLKLKLPPMDAEVVSA